MMPRYNRFHYEVCRDFRGSPHCWTGTPEYRIRLRDTFWLGLVHLLPIMNSWDEALAEDEHMVLHQVRRQVDWNQAFARPALVLQVDDECAKQEGAAWQNVTRYEEALANLGLMYRFISAEEKESEDAVAVIDARHPFRGLKFKADGGLLPDSLKQEMPLEVANGYACSYVCSQDRRTLLAYVYNTTNHEKDYMWLCGRYHRSPKPVALEIQVKNLPASKLIAQLYDLNTKQMISAALLKEGKVLFNQGFTQHDYFILVTPS